MTTTMKYSVFYPRDAMLARYWLWSCVCPSASVFVKRRSSILKRLNESSWFLTCELPATYPTLCFKEIQTPPKSVYFPVKLCPKLCTWKILPRPVDRRNVSTEVDALRDKLATVVGQKFTIFATVHVLPTILASLSAMSVYLSAQHDPYSARRAGPSATVDSCDV